MYQVSDEGVRAVVVASDTDLRAAVEGDASSRYSRFLTEALIRVRAENKRLRQAVANQQADDLCWVTDLEAVKTLPKAEFLESCARFHAQQSESMGEHSGLPTIAELEAQLAQAQGAPGSAHFIVTPEQRARVGEWLQGHIGHVQPVTYQFTPTERGYSVSAQCSCGLWIDLD